MMDLLGLSGNTKAPGYGSAATAFKVEGFDPNTLFEQFNAQEMEQDPGYAFRLSEGQKAIERSTAAKSGLQSGAALKAAARYGQEMGSQEYQNAFNRFQATKAFQAQEYGNAFNRFTTERANMLAPLQALTASGQAKLRLLVILHLVHRKRCKVMVLVQVLRMAIMARQPATSQHELAQAHLPHTVIMALIQQAHTRVLARRVKVLMVKLDQICQTFTAKLGQLPQMPTAILVAT
jgi:hypothetical protein